MRHFHPILLLATLLLLAGCIELEGQRITMHYDAATDRLTLVLHYDGIYNSKAKDQSDAEARLREFVAKGELMLLDWFGAFSADRVREAADEPSTPPALRALSLKLAGAVHTEILGHYRDAQGHLGVAQLVMIEGLTELLAAANAAITEDVLAEDPESNVRWQHTMRRWRTIAEQGHAWLAREGHALLLRFPAERHEWQHHCFEVVGDLSDDARRDGGQPMPGLGHQLLAYSPLSVVQDGEQITIHLGDVSGPSTMRYRWRDAYEPNVEAVVLECVPADLHARLAAALLDDVKAGGALASYLQLAPPDEKLRAVAARLSGPAPQAALATRWLEQFVRDWNVRDLAPKPPAVTADAAAWDTFVRELVVRS